MIKNNNICVMLPAMNGVIPTVDKVFVYLVTCCQIFCYLL